MWGERNNTKIMYRRVTVTVHTCAFMHNFTSTDVSVFFLSKCVKYSTFCIYETPTSVHLLYAIFYINNIFMSWRERERERVRWRENVRGEK